MTNPPLKARGYFWWGDEVIPEGNFAPFTCVNGELEVSATGRIALKLDAALTRGPDRLAAALDRRPPTLPIFGILSGSNQYVRLANLLSNGVTFSSGGPSTEGFIAGYCLIANEPFLLAEPKFTHLQLSLDGYEEWLGLRSIEVTSEPHAVTARYTQPAQHSWKLDIGCLTLDSNLRHPMPGRLSTLSLTERSHFKLIAKRAMNVDRAVELASRLEDLMILLTDSLAGLDFPTLKTRRRSGTVQLYYPRWERLPEPLDLSGCWARFQHIAAVFGSIVESWLNKHEFFGPGFHLYLGNRRQRQLYPEHRFASLVWGLESLNRRMPSEPANSRIQEKIDRIVKQVSSNRDRKWVKGHLSHALEPNLAIRLSETFNTLPLDFDKKEMDAFTKHCAARRNDVSHFGGMREPGSYETFLTEVMKLNEALDYLYHAKLLQMIGLPDDHIRWWFLESFRSYRIGETLKAAGLTLKPIDKPAG